MGVIVCMLLIFLVIVLWCHQAQNNKKESMFVSQPEFVMYYDPNCKICQAVMPEWHMLESAHRNGCLKVYSVDVTQDPYYAERKNTILSGVPTFVMYPYGHYNSKEEYTGPRRARDMHNWLQRRLVIMQVC